MAVVKLYCKNAWLVYSRVDSGGILFDGKDMATMHQEERKELRQQIGMLFQGSALFDSIDGRTKYKVPFRHVHRLEP